jgi:hypothetical protein
MRFLAEQGMVDAAVPVADVGVRLGEWLDFRQAITLHGVLNPEPATKDTEPAAHTRRAGVMTGEALSRHVDKVRTQLVQTIAQGGASGSGLTRIEMPPAELVAPVELKTAFEPYRRFYAAHQRQMETAVRNLRSQVRGQLNKGSKTLQQLATLDAAFENILSEREAVLLGKVPKLLEKRFAQALKQHLKKSGETAPDEAMATPAQPLAWLMALRQDLRTALLAELDTRLQPTLGLLEAFNADNTPKQ